MIEEVLKNSVYESIYLYLNFQSAFRFTAKLKSAENSHIKLLPIVHSLSNYQYLNENLIFVTLDEPTLTHHYHTVYNVDQGSLYCAFYEFSNMHLMFFHVFSGLIIHCLLVLNNILLSACRTNCLSIHPLNQTAINIYVQVLDGHKLSTYLGKYQGAWLLDCVVRAFLVL